MYFNLFLALHLVSATIWIGGMFFAYVILRPVAGAQFDAPERLRLWKAVLGRFFHWVWLAVLALVATGLYMVLVQFGGFATVPLYVHAMTGLSVLMVAIFAWVFFVPFAALSRNVEAQVWPNAGNALAAIRKAVGLNLIVSMLLLVIVGGRLML